MSFIIWILLLLGSEHFETKSPNHLDKVTVSGRKILLNENPYFIKGVCYHPVPKGETKRSFSTLREDLRLMQEAGINTIRVYEPIDDKLVLDKIAAAGLKLIVGFGYNQNGKFDILSGTYLDYIKKFKDHKAILFWELGNEYNYHPEWFGGDISVWFSAMEQAAVRIRTLDANHPVATAHGELPDSATLKACPNIDIWGMNVYRWDEPETILAQWRAVSTKPMYFSEAGSDSYMRIAAHGYKEGTNETAQAHANAKILDAILAQPQTTSGVTLFAFCDEWWKAGNPEKQDVGGWAPNSTGVPYDGTPNEEFWGIVTIERNKKIAYEVVKEKYKAFFIPQRKK